MPIKVTYCGSVPTIDGWTGQQIGWLYGMHLVEGEGTSYKCERCGFWMGWDISSGPEFSNQFENGRNFQTGDRRK